MPAVSGSKYLVQAGWDDVPHLDEQTKQELLNATPPYLRAARTKGEPSLGAGAIYPIPVSEISVAPFLVPDHWPRSYALDVGWKRTAALWMAVDPVTGVCYAYSEHYMGQAVPVVHAEAIKSRGAWVPGVMDYAAHSRSQRDGETLAAEYEELGLQLSNANKAVDAGIQAVWQLLQGGRLKVFTTLGNFLAEYQLYRRDENGRIVKENDHLMDCLRYWVMSGREIATVRPQMLDVIGAGGIRAADGVGY